MFLRFRASVPMLLSPFRMPYQCALICAMPPQKQWQNCNCSPLHLSCRLGTTNGCIRTSLYGCAPESCYLILFLIRSPQRNCFFTSQLQSFPISTVSSGAGNRLATSTLSAQPVVSCATLRLRVPLQEGLSYPISCLASVSGFFGRTCRIELPFLLPTYPVPAPLLP